MTASTRSPLTTRLDKLFPDLWPAAPDYLRYDRERILRYLDSIDVVLSRSGNYPDHSAALAQTVDFVERSFALYEGRLATRFPADRVFVVPNRIVRDDPTHGSEPAEAMNLLDEAYGIDSSISQRIISCLPPAVISSYDVSGGRQGHVVAVPVSADIVKDLGVDRAVARARAMVRDAGWFARFRLGARVMGLGATLPALTGFGREVSVPGLVTTTGHGGTVHLIRSLARDVADAEACPRGVRRIGVLGAAGSIGASVLAALLQEFPATAFTACDKAHRVDRVRQRLTGAALAGRVRITDNAAEVLRECDLIVGAITEKIDPDRIVPDADLRGRVFIDDSQPGCVDREQWEARGGLLVWPIGSAVGASGALRRVNDYRYGTRAGLLRGHDLWGCEAEAAALALTGEHAAALDAPVTPEAAVRIGRLCDHVGIRAAEPQSYGRPVALRSGA